MNGADDELAAAIVAVIGDEKRDGLSPQGEAAVRLALNHAHVQAQAAKAPKVEIVEKRNQPTTCKVWIGGVLVFSGRDHSADIQTQIPVDAQPCIDAGKHLITQRHSRPECLVPEKDQPDSQLVNDEWKVDF